MQRTFLKKSEPDNESKVRFYGRKKIANGAKNLLIYLVVTFEEVISREGVQTLNEVERAVPGHHKLVSFYFLEEIRAGKRIECSFLQDSENGCR